MNLGFLIIHVASFIDVTIAVTIARISSNKNNVNYYYYHFYLELLTYL